MKYIYAIYDRIAAEYVGLRMYQLMVFRTDQEAARYFADAINDTTSILNKHPSDYDLRNLGHITAEGYIRSTDDHQIIITGDALVGLQQPALVKEA